MPRTHAETCCPRVAQPDTPHGHRVPARGPGGTDVCKGQPCSRLWSALVQRQEIWVLLPTLTPLQGGSNPPTLLPHLSQEVQRGVGNGVGENPPFLSSLGMEIKLGSSLGSKCNKRAGLNSRISWRPDERGWKELPVSQGTLLEHHAGARCLQARRHGSRLSLACWNLVMGGGTGRGLEGLRDPLSLDRSGGLSPLQSFPPTVPACSPRCRPGCGQPACSTGIVFLVIFGFSAVLPRK